MFNPGLAPGQSISNRQLMDIFHCACEGGIRYSKATDTIVIVVNNTKSGLPNVWQGQTLEFSGRPLKDGKTINGPNKRLLEFLQDRKDVFLFEVNTPGRYIFRGRVKEAAPIRLEKTADNKEYPLFPLELDKAI